VVVYEATAGAPAVDLPILAPRMLFSLRCRLPASHPSAAAASSERKEGRPSRQRGGGGNLDVISPYFEGIFVHLARPRWEAAGSQFL
jgi:hypothetical protein